MPTLSDWTPADTVTDHSGNPLIANRRYFVPPPPEIGTVLSAYSALGKGKTSYPRRTRFRVTMASMIPGLILGIIMAITLIGSHHSDSDSSGPYDPPDTVTGKLTLVAELLMLTGVFVLGPAALVYSVMMLCRTEYVCTYVGTNGLADFDLNDFWRDKPGKILSFSNAAEMSSQSAPELVHGIKVGEAFVFWWKDAERKSLFEIKGQYYSSQIPPENIHHFATAAVRAWYDFVAVAPEPMHRTIEI